MLVAFMRKLKQETKFQIKISIQVKLKYLIDYLLLHIRCVNNQNYIKILQNFYSIFNYVRKIIIFNT